MHPIRPFATLVFRLAERQRHGPYRQRSSLLLYGRRHVGQIDVVVAGMIPVANVEAKVRHAAAPVAPQQFNPENSRLFARLRVLSPETRTGCSIGGRLESQN